jgi:uncharacterized protein
MAEFKSMTVQALRDLARKALGRGHSKLKTKTELIAALQAAERKVTGAAEKAATKMKEATGRAARATEKFAESVRGKGREAAKAKPPKEKEKEKPKEKERDKERPAARAPSKAGQAARDAARAVREVAGAAKAGARRVRDAMRGEPEPDPEGYMVARVAGEDAVRVAPHPMTESAMEAARGDRSAAAKEARQIPAEPQGAPNAFDEGLGELPWNYADDALMALPRDPKTLFLYWDHAQETLRHAWEGLDGARPQLWVFAREPDGRWTRVRALDFALESRSYYIHDLEPGRVYRAEIHVIDRLGKDKLLPKASNEMMLPPVGPSPIIDDRFMRILWSEPLQRLLREAHPGGPFPDDVRAQLARLSDWSRFAGRVWGGSAGGMGGRPFSPVSAPSSPSSPSSPWGRSDGEGR